MCKLWENECLPVRGERERESVCVCVHVHLHTGFLEIVELEFNLKDITYQVEEVGGGGSVL